MLIINHLNITTLKGRALLKDFSFVLNDHEKIALIGEEGNGKSTLLKVIAGIDTGNYVNVEGEIIRKGKISYMPQHIDPAEMEEEVISYLCKEDMDYKKIYHLFSDLHIDSDLLNRKIKQLSGGEKVRISLAKILYEDADILLLDEPTNDIDLKTLLWLEDYIQSSEKSILFVSHDEQLLKNCAQGLLHLEQLKRKSEAKTHFARQSYDDYISERSHLIQRNNQISRKEHSQFHAQLERYAKIYQKVEQQQRSISRQDPHGGQLLKKKMHSLKAQGRRMEDKERNLTEKIEPEEAIHIYFEDVDLPASKVVLDLHLSELKAGDKLLSRNIDLYMTGGEKACIIGENGTGKTSLLRHIWEEMKDRKDLSVGYMPQNYEEVLDYSQSPIAILQEAGDDRTKAQNILGSLKFSTEEMSHPIKELSQGQICKILLAKLILEKRNVLLMDEPSRNLSPLSNPELRKILIDFKGAVLFVSHDRSLIEEVSDHIYELSEKGLKKIQ